MWTPPPDDREPELPRDEDPLEEDPRDGDEDREPELEETLEPDDEEPRDIVLRLPDKNLYTPPSEGFRHGLSFPRI